MTKTEENILRSIIREELKKHTWAGSQPEESYDEELLDDEAYEASSVYVPDDIKKKINKWAKDMGLSTSKK